MELKHYIYFTFLLILLSSLSFSQVYIYNLNFNQTNTTSIIGIPSTTDQNSINNLLNTNLDNNVWSVAEDQIPHRKIKTVEYFIYQRMDTTAANTDAFASFTVYIPERNPNIVSAIIEIRNLVYNAQISSGSVILSNGTTNITIQTFTTGPAATGENMYYTFIVNATEALRRFITRSGTYNLILYVRLNQARQAENAKLILTYEYDSDSPREVKTVRFFIGQRNTSLAVGSSTNFVIPPLNLPEGNIVIRDAFFETYIHLAPSSTTNQGISIDLNGANAISGTAVINNAGQTTIDYVFLYRNIFDISTSNVFNFRPTAGSAIDTVGTELVLTYEYDSNSTLQLKTIRYLIGQDGGLYTAAHTATFTRTIIIPEDIREIRSVYNRITFSIAYGSGAGTTMYTTTIGVNSSILGQVQPRIDHSLGLIDEQVSHSMILYNASSLYNIRNGTTVVCSVFSSAASTSYYTGSKGCELVITYVYNVSNSTSFVNSVEYFVGNNYNSALASSVNFPFSINISEPNHLIRDAYLSIYGFTGSATAATNTLVSYINVPGYVSQTCNFRNTGEARSDFCWDYVGDNITAIGSYTAVISSGVTRWFASKLTLTYSYTPFYKVEIEHNTSIFYEGILRNISILINFTSSAFNTFRMLIYDFKNNVWNNTICPSLLVNPNQFYAYWCNISNSEINNFVSSNNLVRIRFLSVEDLNPGILGEEYVQFFITYEVINYQPLLFERLEDPPSPTTYAQGRKYTFKIRVLDLNGENDIDLVLFEFNGINETVNNYVIINSTTREYIVEKYDLPASQNGYIFRWYAKDKRNAWSNIVEGIYVVNKAIPIIQLNLSNDNVYYPNETNATCYLVLGDNEHSLKLYRNNTLISSRKNRASEVILLAAGVYNYSCHYEETQNYTSLWIKDVILRVNKGIPKVFLEINGVQENYITYYPTEINVTAWIETLYNEGQIKLYRNGILIGSGKKVSEISILAAGDYYFDVIFEETQNYTYYEIKNRYLKINKGLSTAQLILYPESPITYGTETIAICIKTNPEAEGKLWRNGTEVTHENNTAIVLPAGIWYYECNVTETQNYTGAFASSIYIVNKAPTEVKLFLNGSENDRIYTYGDYANITAIINISNLIVFIEANFTGIQELIAYGIEKSSIITNNFGAGIYNITAYFPGNQNYTSSFKSLMMIVNKKPTLTILWINGTRENKIFYDAATVNFTVELINGKENFVQLLSNYSDGRIKVISTGNSPLQSILYLDKGGIYKFIGYYPGNVNYTESNESWIVKIAKMNSNIEILPSQTIGINDIFTIIGKCECLYSKCNNVSIQLEINGKVISNETPYIRLVNGNNPLYFEGEVDYVEVYWNVTSSSIGNYVAKIKCNSSEFSDTYSRELNINVIDNKAPKWLLNRSFPLKASYQPNAYYRFSIVWIDESEIEEILIEHNFSGTIKNETMKRNESEFYFEIYDLAAGNYYWKSYAKDIYGNWNVSNEFIYTVDKAPVEIKIYFNDSEIIEEFEVYEIVNITAVINISGKKIFLDSTIPNWITIENESYITAIVNLSKIGKFKVTSYFPGDQNYSYYFKEVEISVVDKISPILLIVGQNRNWIGVNETLIIFSKWNDNYDLDYAWLETNESGYWRIVSTAKLNLSENIIWSNFTWRNPNIVAGSIISWKICANDTSGNFNCSQIFNFFVNASLLWNLTLNERIYSSAAIGDVNNDGEIDVIVATFNGTLYAIRAKNGEIVWNFSTNGRIVSSPSILGLEGENFLRIFIGSYDFNLYAINGSDGRKIWNFSAMNRIVSSAAIGDVNNDGKIDVIIGSEDGNIYALDANSGNLIWSFKTGGRIISSPSLRKIENIVYVFVGSYDFNLYAINGSDGRKIWNFSAMNRIDSTPLIDDFDNDGNYEVVFGSYDRNLYVLDAKTGILKWNYTTGNWITSSPITLRIKNDKKIIATSHDSKVYCFNPDGSINWTFTIPTGGRVPYLPSAFDVNNDGIQDVIVGATDGRLYAINGLNGNLIWFYTLGSYIYTSPAIADLNKDGKLDIAVGSFDRNVYALDPPSWNMFGGNERNTRIYDFISPKLIYYNKSIDRCKVDISSKWKDFSNLEIGIIKIKYNGLEEKNVLKLKGPEDWINYTILSCNNFKLEIQVYDEYENIEFFEDYINISKLDIPPKIISINISPNSTTYSEDQVYKIIVKIEDDYGISEVLLENDFNGMLQNVSMEKEGENYVYEVRGLKSGLYKVRINVCDISSNCISSEWHYIEVKKLIPNIYLSLNKELAIYPEEISISCYVDKKEKSRILIIINETIVAESYDNKINFSIKLPAGFWNIKCVSEESENYLENFDLKQIEILKGIPRMFLKINNEENDLILQCPTNITINAFSLDLENNMKFYLYSFYNQITELLAIGINITINKTLNLAGLYQFIYNSTEGKNLTSNQITRNVLLLDTKKPKNIFYKRFLDKNGLTIISRWKDECGNVSKAIIKENSNGEKEILIYPIDGWINYTIPRNDLYSTYGCVWIFNRICIKRINFEITVFDSSNNFASIKDRIIIIFISSKK